MASCLSDVDGRESNENYSKFIIIGGGIAGLSAASLLAKNGITDFKLLEARNRLGGRIMTVQIGGSRVELGANWIHGVLGNPLYELGTSQGLLSNSTIKKPVPYNVAATTEDGRRLPFAILQEVYRAYYWFFKRCEEYYVYKYRPPHGIVSVGQHIELEISLYLKKFPPQQRLVRRLVFDYLLKRECCSTGCHSMNDVDLFGIGSYTELSGGNIKVPPGFSSLLAPLIAAIPEVCIFKGTPVKKIKWNYGREMERNDRGYESDDSNSSNESVKTVFSVTSSICPTPLERNISRYPNVSIECGDGQQFFADYVICTLPLGILRRQPDIFEPPLPASKTCSLGKLNFGTVNKIILEYDKPFLTPDISEVILLWNRPTEIEKSIPMEKRWFRKIYSFSKITETILLAWISGEEAEYMETLRLNIVADTCTEILKNFLADPHIPKPKACIFTAWYNQPYSMGSYSSIGLHGRQSDIEVVSQPLYQKKIPVVAFAGEHCHPSFYSTAHGAYLTGRNAAQMMQRVSRSTATVMEEEILNLASASVADLSTWLEEIRIGQKKSEPKNSTQSELPSFETPR